ncbi:hypothetical protein HMPREF1403_00299 [Helicobacter pylori GAM201Ai]|nr:hypothetical protein HMPREF1403_00299 [Helicobacter pylori GAM201Ai]
MGAFKEGIGFECGSFNSFEEKTIWVFLGIVGRLGLKVVSKESFSSRG